jgi:hypothetical protein
MCQDMHQIGDQVSQMLPAVIGNYTNFFGSVIYRRYHTTPQNVLTGLATVRRGTAEASVII